MRTHGIISACLMATLAAPAGFAEEKADAAPEAAPAAAAEPAAPAPEFKTDTEKISFNIGYEMGSNMKNQDMVLDMPVFERGLKAGLAGTPSPLDPVETRKLMASYSESRMAAQRVKFMQAAGENKTKANEFLAENKKKEGVIALPSGLQYQVLEEGKEDAAKPTKTAPVTVHYTGKLMDGTVFDSSHDRGQPVQFQLNQVIPGWSEGLQQIAVGSKCRLFIPPELAYGERGAPPRIGPNALLIFDVELISINEKPQPAISPAPPRPSAQPAAQPAEAAAGKLTDEPAKNPTAAEAK